ncbi:MAG: hypothetical protein M9962_13760 [Oligoflexia bacterium]|nr:hypothetical protein [Oligoflexia bacterium]
MIIAIRFLFTIGGLVILINAGSSLKDLTMNMAQAAATAQKSQMKYGDYSRMLWNNSKLKSAKSRKLEKKRRI